MSLVRFVIVFLDTHDGWKTSVSLENLDSSTSIAVVKAMVFDTIHTNDDFKNLRDLYPTLDSIGNLRYHYLFSERPPLVFTDKTSLDDIFEATKDFIDFRSAHLAFIPVSVSLANILPAPAATAEPPRVDAVDEAKAKAEKSALLCTRSVFRRGGGKKRKTESKTISTTIVMTNGDAGKAVMIKGSDVGITEGLFKPPRGSSISPSSSVDRHWYTDDEINALLDHYIGRRPEVAIITGIDLDQHEGGTLAENLDQRETQIALIERLAGLATPTIILPIKLGNNHWVALYIHHHAPERDRTQPAIGYFDPLGHAMPRTLRCLLTRRYPDIEPKDYLDSPIRLQSDGYNCGPWVVEILRELVEHCRLPAEDFDISAARVRHQEVLHPPAAGAGEESSLNCVNSKS